MRRPPPRFTLALTTGLTAGLAALVPVTAGHAAPVSRQQAYADAAARYGVPESVLLAVSFLESRWDAHAGQPSTAGGYGPMNLTDVADVSADALAAQPNEDARGDTQRPLATPDRPEYTGDQPSLRTLGTAADLTGTPERTLRTDAAANIAGGAALLARYQKDLGVSGSDPADWYGAVARYSGAPDEAGARTFADEVFDVLRSGESRRTDGGDTVSLAADPQVSPATGQLAALHLTKADTSGTECPNDAGCDFIPAAYALNSADPGDYGNYDKADRPRDMKIQYLVIHDNEGYYNGTISWFQNPKAYAAANYELRSSDGHITQMIENKDLAWQAGNWYINMHSIGIEHEGFAATGATWYTEAMYRQSAKLVRYLAGRYGIPLDRQHIIGHDNVPGTLPTTIRNMHWDPGPFWDWDHYMDLVRGHADHGAGGPDSGLVTVKPGFASNQQVVTGCDKSGSGTPCAAQPTNFAYLRTAPSDDAPLVSDPKLHAGPGTTDIADVAARATDGQQFAVADRKPGWTAIWYLGQEAWLHSSQVRPAVGFVVTPKPGKDSVPVYGRAYPETSAYDGSPVPVQAVTPLGYLFASGQRYPLGLTDVPADYYYAPTIDLSMPGDHTVVRGHDRYFEIQFGHRVAYVRAADVTVRNANAAS